MSELLAYPYDPAEGGTIRMIRNLIAGRGHPRRRRASLLSASDVGMFWLLSLFMMTAGTSLGEGCANVSANDHVLAGGSLPQQQETSFQRGLVALQQDHPESALKELTIAEREHPEDASVRNFRGIVLAKLGRTAEAAAEYRQAIRFDPQFEAAYRNVAFLEWNDHRLDAASLDLNAALKLSPEDTFARYYLGRVELELQQYGDAFRDLQRSGIALPEDPEVLLLAAKGNLALGNEPEAKALADRLASHRLTGPQTSRLASLLIALHENDTAIHVLRKWGEDNPHQRGEWASFDLGLTYLHVGEYRRSAEQARLVLPSEVELRERSAPIRAAEAWSLIGIADAHLGQTGRAVEAFRRAVDLAPGREDHWLNLTRELMELSRFTEAIATTREAIRIQPSSYALQLRLGAAELAVDRYDDAEKVFRTLLLAGDPLPTSSIGLAQVLLRTGRASQAVTELVSAKQRLGRSFLLSYFQGLAYDRAAQPDEAASAFREALQENPESAEAHFELGKVELKLAHFDQSIVELGKAIQLDPGDLRAGRLLKQAYQRSGTTNAAEKLPEIVPPVLAPDLLGDFILPEWQEPKIEITHEVKAVPPG